MATIESSPQFAFAYAQFMALLECTAQDLTKGYVALGADDKTISFGRIQQQADEVNELRWFDIDQLPDDINPVTQHLIPMLLKRIKTIRER